MEKRIVLSEELVDRFCEIIDTALKEVASNNTNIFMNDYENITKGLFIKAMDNVNYHFGKKENADVSDGFDIISFRFRNEQFKKNSIDFLSMENFVSSLIEKYIHGKVTSENIIDDGNDSVYFAINVLNDTIVSPSFTITSHQPKDGPLVCRLCTPRGKFFINPEILKKLFVSYKYSIIYTGSKELIKDDIVNHRLMTPLLIYWSIKSDSEFSKQLSNYFEIMQDFENDPNIERLRDFMRFLNQNWMKECRNYIVDHDLTEEHFWYDFNEYISYELLQILHNKYFEVNIKNRVRGPFAIVRCITESLEG